MHTFIARDARAVTAAPGWSEVIAGWQEAFPLVTESVPDPPAAGRASVRTTYTARRSNAVWTSFCNSSVVVSPMSVVVCSGALYEAKARRQ